MTPHHRGPSETQSLTGDQAWKAREFDRRNLSTQEILVSKVAELERDLSVMKTKLGFIAVGASIVGSIAVHVITQYLGLHR